MSVADRPISELIKTGSVDHIQSDATVLDAIRYMAEVRRGAIPVIADGRLVGMFSERDLMLRVVLANREPADVRVHEVRTSDLVVARTDETHSACLLKMQEMHVRHLPVVDGDRLVGLISLRDLMQVEADRRAREIEMLHANAQAFLDTHP